MWRALTHPALLGSWFMQNNLEPVLGHGSTFWMNPQKGWDGITHCCIIRLDALKCLAYTYRGSASGEKTLARARVNTELTDAPGKHIFTQPDTVLSFTLEKIRGGTRLLLEHSGFTGLKLVIVSLVMGMGWKKQLHKKLPVVLDQMAKLD